jgi:O-antigen ligase
LAKKGPLLSLIIIFLFSVGLIHLKYQKLLLGLALLAGCLLLTSESAILKYKNILKLNSSITLRAEHYFFGFHVFKKNPLWGVGLYPNLFPYMYCDNDQHSVRICLARELIQHFQTRINTLSGEKPLTNRDLEILLHLASGWSHNEIERRDSCTSTPSIQFLLNNIYKRIGVNGHKGILKIISSYNQDKFSYNPKFLDRSFYYGYYTTLRTFENIVLTFLVEMGGLFSAVYFAGVIYIFAVFFKKFRAPPKKNLAGMLTIGVLVGFAFISCTFDTLRFPNLNWLFHSFLGLMVNLQKNSSEYSSEIN